MNEKELGKALLRGEAGVDAGALTEKILQRDRWRMGGLAVVCVVAWMAVVMLPWATILPMLAKVVRFQTQSMEHRPPGQGDDGMVDVFAAVKVGTMATFYGSMGSMFVAAVCTVSLIVLSRRATLRQVNARLGEIAGELRRIGGK